MSLYWYCNACAKQRWPNGVESKTIGRLMPTPCAQCNALVPKDEGACVTTPPLAAPWRAPRRSRLDLMSEAERAIYDATQAVERAGADTRLTDAVVLLQAAREKVADFVDGVGRGDDGR